MHASVSSKLHIKLPFFKIYFIESKLSIFKWLHGINWISFFKLMTDLLLPSFFFTKNILLTIQPSSRGFLSLMLLPLFSSD